MHRVNIFHWYKNGGARRCVAVVLTQVQRQAGSRDLRVQRKIRFKPVFPVQFEAQKIQVKLFGFFFRETAQDGDGGGNSHGVVFLGE